MLVIKDEQVVKRLQEIAEGEKRPVDELLAEMVAHYPSETVDVNTQPDKSEAVKQVRRKAYAKARTYWKSVGELIKAKMTDDELDAEFGAFDKEGIPRLKSELQSLEPPVGSLAYAAMISARGIFRSGKTDLVRRSQDILDEHFADELASQIRGEDAGKQDSC